MELQSVQGRKSCVWFQTQNLDTLSSDSGVYCTHRATKAHFRPRVGSRKLGSAVKMTSSSYWSSAPREGGPRLAVTQALEKPMTSGLPRQGMLTLAFSSFLPSPSSSQKQNLVFFLKGPQWWQLQVTDEEEEREDGL